MSGDHGYLRSSDSETDRARGSGGAAKDKARRSKALAKIDEEDDNSARCGGISHLSV